MVFETTMDGISNDAQQYKARSVVSLCYGEVAKALSEEKLAHAVCNMDYTRRESYVLTPKIAIVRSSHEHTLRGDCNAFRRFSDYLTIE
jgi:hypothetical protein